MEVCNWVLQFADDAEVLNLDSLRQDVVKAVKKLSERYDINRGSE